MIFFYFTLIFIIGLTSCTDSSLRLQFASNKQLLQFSGIPSGATNLKKYTIRISGESIDQYSWKVGIKKTTDCTQDHGYSEPQDVNFSIQVTVASDDDYTFCAKGRSGQTGQWHESNSVSYVHWKVDSTPPVLIGHIDDGKYYSSLTVSPELKWNLATDLGSGIRGYEIALGTTEGGSDVFPWTDIGQKLSHQVSGLNLKVGNKYYSSLRAVDLAGNISSPIFGNGWIVDTLNPLLIATYNLNYGTMASLPSLPAIHSILPNCTKGDLLLWITHMHYNSFVYSPPEGWKSIDGPNTDSDTLGMVLIAYKEMGEIENSPYTYSAGVNYYWTSSLLCFRYAEINLKNLKFKSSLAKSANPWEYPSIKLDQQRDYSTLVYIQGLASKTNRSGISVEYELPPGFSHVTKSENLNYDSLNISLKKIGMQPSGETINSTANFTHLIQANVTATAVEIQKKIEYKSEIIISLDQSGEGFKGRATPENPSHLSGVQFYIDGLPYGKRIFQSPYETQIESKKFAKGTHSLSAQFYTPDGDSHFSNHIDFTITRNSRILYVNNSDPLASDTNSGLTAMAPFKTISKAMQSIQAGDEVLIENGVYREVIKIPSNILHSASGQTTTIRGAGDQVIIKGSVLTFGSDWLNEGSNLYSYAYPTSSDIRSPQQVFLNGSMLRQVGGSISTAFSNPNYPGSYGMSNSIWSYEPSKKVGYITGNTGTMAPNQFYFDEFSNKIYIKLMNSLMPTDQIEISKFRNLMSNFDTASSPVANVVTGVSYNLIVDNITFQHSNTTAWNREGLISINCQNCIFRRLKISYADGNGISIYQGSKINVENSIFTQVGQTCISSRMSDQVQIWNNEISFCNYRFFQPTWEAGGIKIAGGEITNHDVAGNDIYSNYGSGLWFDTVGGGHMISDNRIRYNLHEGIFYEMSRSVVMNYNTIYGNGRRGIYAAGSYSMNIENNLIFNNYMNAIVSVIDERTFSSVYTISNQNAYDNRFKSNFMAFNDKVNHIQLILPGTKLGVFPVALYNPQTGTQSDSNTMIDGPTVSPRLSIGFQDGTNDTQGSWRTGIKNFRDMLLNYGFSGDEQSISGMYKQDSSLLNKIQSEITLSCSDIVYGFSRPCY